MTTAVPGRDENQRNQEATVYLGNLDERVTDSLVWELMLQAGPVANVHLPRDRVSMSHQGFGFCEFMVPEDAEYACKIMNQIKMFGKPIRVNMASSDRKPVDIGANLFVGNLDEEVTESLLHTAFSNFGTLTQPAKIARDDTFHSKGYGFVSYDSFEASDLAIESMDGQYLMNKPVTVQYAFKKEGHGERHGSEAERLLAAQAKKNNPTTGANGIMTGANGIMQASVARPMVPPPPPVGFSAAPVMPGLMPGYAAPTAVSSAAMPPPPAGFQPGPPPGFAPVRDASSQP